MKNKRNTYLLLILVIVIWGIIAYKIISSLGNNSTPAGPEQKFEVSFNPKPVKGIDTFSIKANYRDPFLGTVEKPKSVIVSKPKTTQPPEIEIPVSYSGFIKDKKTREKIFFVHINGMQHLMKANKEINGVKLVSGNDKEITVLLNKKRKIIKISH
ncbi:hypothetical protein [Abyssalbus ytuae]|uniref:Uncharacterized protein n=1 Tax=Abyssalbus ytuae TaxID=2926907 RepID=A0A9E6ZW51_9FLAO|nr:hypothetical protein [Abyssalbus ytuae]UOB17896.1 hypothetical protein MQE35_01035 [Abyssalbus ytuae]